ATFFRLHAGAEALISAGLFQFALLFPTPHRLARWRFADWAIALPALVLYEAFLYRPPLYSALLQFNMLHLGVAGVLLGARSVGDYRRSESRLARVRIRIVMVGTVLGILLPGLLGVLTGVGEQVAINTGVLLPPVFILSLAYAVLKHDVFEIDAMMKRGVYYL